MEIFSRKELIDILKDDSRNDWLFTLADAVRHEFVGDEVHLRGLIEFSNICKRTCKYCGLRCENKNLQRYRLKEDEIILYAQNAAELGYKTVVLQSGEDEFYSAKKLAQIVEEIKKLDIAVTLSVGEMSFKDYKKSQIIKVYIKLADHLFRQIF